MRATGNTVFTIGHSTHQTEAFLALLRQHGIEAVADVRSSPFSRFNPQFNREVLERRLKSASIRYVFLGQELGARSVDQSCYQNGRVQYSRLAQTALFQSGLERVIQGACDFRIALMCAEKEPLDCHRTLLVARALVERGISVQHIHPSGDLEAYESGLDRLLDLTGLPKEDMFRSRAELISQAIARQEQNIAYADDNQPATVRENSP